MRAGITANLPSRDFAATEAFYARLGFDTRFRNAGWMILGFGDTQVEFFPHPALDPRESWFSACLRCDDLEALHARFSQAGLPVDATSVPRLSGIIEQEGAPCMFALVDEDGSLWRVMDMTGASA
ncbi:bleomycin resistance protein [Salipiger bermudensis]|uniref:bleomycin resistance protein n=1 Tax=Salipiger bermudensis TaxID=344736 RepID=UPI001CD6254B|nr:bleomycin resistance protein [Salipiger bermudensis]MCA0961532.1 bleomycin resistance protein [Salipiger bermudensis]